MASSYSSSLRLELIGTGEQSGTWGTTTNRNLGTLLEQAIAGYTTVVMGDADATLSQVNGDTDQSRAAMLRFASSVTLSATRNVVCPALTKSYIARNDTSGGQAIFFKTSLGNGVLIPSGASTLLYCNGTDVVSAIDHLPLLAAPTFSAGTATATTSMTSPLVKVSSATAPGSPSNGDIWHAGNKISARVGNSTQVIAQSPIILSARVAATFTGVKSLSYTAADASVNMPGFAGNWFPAVPTYPSAGTYTGTPMAPTAPVEGVYEVSLVGYLSVASGASAAVINFLPEWLGAPYAPAYQFMVLDTATNTGNRPFAINFFIEVPATSRGMAFEAGGGSATFTIDAMLNIRWVASLP